MALSRSDHGKDHLFLYIVSRLYTGVVTEVSPIHVISVAGQYLRISDFCLLLGFRVQVTCSLLKPAFTVSSPSEGRQC